jgi:hypothetical protein
MANEWSSIQIRIGIRTRDQIKKLAAQHGNSQADILRGALELGLQVMGVLLDAQGIVVREYLKLLKGRNRRTSIGQLQPNKHKEESLKASETGDKDI